MNEPCDRLFELMADEFARCMFPDGREAYMREFERKFDVSLNNMNVSGGIDRRPSQYWKTK